MNQLNNMEKLTFEQIIIELKQQKIEVKEFAYCDIENPLPNIGSWKEVDQYGGEGQGDTWYSVKYFEEQDMYIRVDGFYSSYNGTDFRGWAEVTQVTPKEKTITVYE